MCFLSKSDYKLFNFCFKISISVYLDYLSLIIFSLLSNNYKFFIFSYSNSSFNLLYSYEFRYYIF